MNTRAEEIFEDLFLRYPDFSILRQSIKDAFYCTYNAYKKNGKLLVCGNGGSAADSEHITAELMKGFLLKRKLKKIDAEKFSQKDFCAFADRLQYGLPVISLASQTALLTALMNDNGADMVFAQQVFVYGNDNDVFWGISTSGNSVNIINAVKVAKTKGIKVIIFSGNTGGELHNISDVCINIPGGNVYKIQDGHMPIYHTICAMIEEEFFGVEEKQSKVL